MKRTYGRLPRADDKNAKCRKLVKGVKPVDFPQATEYNPNIFFKIWRVYPLQCDTLDLDLKD
jgi:hypothetical protein